MPNRALLLFLVLAVAISAKPAPAAAPDADDIAVTLERHGDTVDINVEMTVEASPELVFAVLTDYDHMTGFVSNVQASRIVERDGERLRVEQKSRLAIGPFHLDLANVRDVTPIPFREIRSRVTDGDMKGSAFTTTLVGRGARTWIGNRGRFELDRWLPPIVGPALLEAQTRRQFEEFRAEILRRKAGSS